MAVRSTPYQRAGARCLGALRGSTLRVMSHREPEKRMRRAICFAAILVAALAAPGAQGRSATLILLNGRLWTENPRQPEAEAIAIEGNQILSVGSSAAIRKLAGPDCRIIDLGGRRAVP